MKTDSIDLAYFASRLKEALDWGEGGSGKEIPLQPEDILLDEDVMKLLKISERTLRNYRRDRLLQYTKIGARVYYFRPVLYEDLLSFSQKRKERNKPHDSAESSV